MDIDVVKFNNGKCALRKKENGNYRYKHLGHDDYWVGMSYIEECLMPKDRAVRLYQDMAKAEHDLKGESKVDLEQKRPKEVRKTDNMFSSIGGLLKRAAPRPKAEPVLPSRPEKVHDVAMLSEAFDAAREKKSARKLKYESFTDWWREKTAASLPSKFGVDQPTDLMESAEEDSVEDKPQPGYSICPSCNYYEIGHPNRHCTACGQINKWK